MLKPNSINNLPKELLKKINKLDEIIHKENFLVFLTKLFQNFNVKFVALFGSVVRGNTSFRSDLDVFLVADDFPEKLGDRLDIIYGFFVPNIDFRAHRLEEFNLMVSEWHLTILEVFYDHVFLYDSDNISLEPYNKFLQLLKEGKLFRGDHFWKRNF